MEVDVKAKLLEDGTLVLSVPEEIYSETGRILLEEDGTNYGTLYYMGAEQEVGSEKSEES